jgi:hypothetical protein
MGDNSSAWQAGQSTVNNRPNGPDKPKGDKPSSERTTVGSVIKKRRKRMAKKKHRKLLKKTRIQRRRAGR